MRTPILETERLILRPLLLSDAEHIFNSWTSDPEVAKYMIWDVHESIDDTFDWLKGEVDAIEGDKIYTWGLVLKENNLLFGTIGLHEKNTVGVYSLGYNIMKSYWNNGFTTEAGRRIMEFAKNELNIKHFICCHAIENVASKKVMEKLGFVYEKDSAYSSFSGKKHFESKDYKLEIKL